VGNALEVKEAIDLLQGRGSADLEELSVMLTSYMLILAGQYSTIEQASAKVRNILDSGAGFDKFCELVSFQEGRLDFRLPLYGLPAASLQAEVKAQGEGYVHELNALGVGRTAMLLGAGREKIGDKIDHSVGIQVLKKKGDYVKEGDVLAIIHANDAKLIPGAEKQLLACYHLSEDKPFPQPLIIQTIK